MPANTAWRTRSGNRMWNRQKLRHDSGASAWHRRTDWRGLLFADAAKGVGKSPIEWLEKCSVDRSRIWRREHLPGRFRRRADVLFAFDDSQLGIIADLCGNGVAPRRTDRRCRF